MTDRFKAQRLPIDLLMVEDSADDVELITDSLREAGLELIVRLVEDESAFLAALGERRPDAILSDWTLPDFSGRRAFAIAQERCPDVPFIFISGTISESAAFEALREGASDYVFKHQLQLLFPALTRAVNEAEALRALRESENRLRTVLQNIPDLIWLKDSNGVYLTCNRMFERLYGAREADIVGKTDYDFVDREMADSFRDSDCQVMAAGKTWNSPEWVTFADDGRRALFDTIKTPMFDGAGKLIGVLGIARDDTERKRGEDSLREMQAQLMHQDKLATIGQLAAGVAHEINNPMGFIDSNTVTLMKYVEKYNDYINGLEQELRSGSSGTLPEPLQVLRRSLKMDYTMRDINLLLDQNKEGIERVERIVHDLSTFARATTSATDSADLKNCLDSTINILMNEIKYSAILKREFGDLPNVECNAPQINQVFMNLLINAVHAIKEKGEDLGEIVVRTWCEADNAFVSVSDTGCGISLENMTKIFNAFYTTKEVGKGTGLGLSISDGIVRKHGGEITVKSEVGIGSTFTVRLPLKPPDPSEMNNIDNRQQLS